MNKKGFTIAEVLITLGLIGIVAAMTLPALMSNFQKEQSATALMKAIAAMENANSIMITEKDMYGIRENCLGLQGSGDIASPTKDYVTECFERYVMKKLDATKIEKQVSYTVATANDTTFGSSCNSGSSSTSSSGSGSGSSGSSSTSTSGSGSGSSGSSNTSSSSSGGGTAASTTSSVYQGNNGIAYIFPGYTGKYIRLLIDTNGVEKRPNQAAKDLFEVYIDIDADGKILPYGSKRWKAEGAGTDTWEDASKCNSSTDFTTLAWQYCSGSIVDNGGKVIYKWK